MNIFVLKLISFLIILILFTFAIISCGKNNTHPRTSLNNFLHHIESDNFGNMELTIYYGELVILSRTPITVAQFMDMAYEHSISVDGDRLRGYEELLKRFANMELSPVARQSEIDVRVYYVFEYNNEVILDIAMWGHRNTNVFVNGREFEWNDVFIDVIEPFLPEEKVARLRVYVGD